MEDELFEINFTAWKEYLEKEFENVVIKSHILDKEEYRQLFLVKNVGLLCQHIETMLETKPILTKPTLTLLKKILSQKKYKENLEDIIKGIKQVVELIETKEELAQEAKLRALCSIVGSCLKEKLNTIIQDEIKSLVPYFRDSPTCEMAIKKYTQTIKKFERICSYLGTDPLSSIDSFEEVCFTPYFPKFLNNPENCLLALLKSQKENSLVMSIFEAVERHEGNLQLFRKHYTDSYTEFLLHVLKNSENLIEQVMALEEEMCNNYGDLIKYNVVVQDTLQCFFCFLKKLSPGRLSLDVVKFLHSIAVHHKEVSKSKFVKLMKYLMLIPDKDKLELLLRTALTERLVMGTDIRVEEQWVCLLEKYIGEDYVVHLKKMVQDQQNLKVVSKLSTVLLYQDDYIFPYPDIGKYNYLCPFLQDLASKFQTEYKSSYADRNLTFLASGGRVEIAYKTQVLICSPFIANIFMEFNSREKIEMQEYSKKSGIPPTVLAKYIPLLSNQLIQVQSDSIILADKFPFSSVIDLIPSIIQTQEEKAPFPKSTELLEQEQNILIEVNIIKIVKQQDISYEDLGSEIIRRVSPRFVPSPSQIEKSIQKMIDRDFIYKSINGLYAYQIV